MTLEELEFMRQYPRIPKARVPAVLAEVKRQRAIAEEAKRAAKRGVVTPGTRTPRAAAKRSQSLRPATGRPSPSPK